jgi:hypothetical protein
MNPIVKRLMLGVIGAVALVSVCCKARGNVTWFEGGYSAALAEAAKRKTLVMLDFYTDW